MESAEGGEDEDILLEKLEQEAAYIDKLLSQADEQY